MESIAKPEKWARWPDCKVELFLKIVVVSWTPKLKRDIDNYLSNTNAPLVHLEHKRVKKSAALLGVPDSDSKSLQIKYVRIVESFPKKPDLPLRLQEALKLCEDHPNINFLLGRYFANPNFASLFERFDQLIKSCTQMVVARRKSDLLTSQSVDTPENEASVTDTPSRSEHRPKRESPPSKGHKIHKKRVRNDDLPPQGLRRSDRLAERLRDRGSAKVIPPSATRSVPPPPPPDLIRMKHLPTPLNLGQTAPSQGSVPLSLPSVWRILHQTFSSLIPQDFRNPN